MKKKIISMALSCSMIFSLFSSALNANAETLKNEAGGTTYYVSTLDGNDNNNGLSESKAFYSLAKINEMELKPGDRVLLEAGSVFTNGFLHIKGSGSEVAPIKIDKYGEGNNPRIDTNGQGVWYQDYGKQLDNANHKYKDYVSSAILLYDVEYINISNLEITNKSLNIDTKYNDLNTMNRTGVAAVAQNKGTIDNIYLDNLNIHDVIGNVYDKHMNNGGIYFTVFKPTNEAQTGISKYNDVKIENCIVNNVNRWGIAVGYTAYWDKFLDANISDESIAKYGSTGVQIRNNYVKEAGGDSITTMYCDRPIIEYNVSDGAARQINTTDYSATSSGRVAAAIWPWKCKDAIFQYNEAFDTYTNQDGQAWDADYGDGTIYQYNYSHNNGGGSVMFCGIQAVNSVFRYNISENDLAGVLNIPGNPDAHIYNNTFYMKEGVPFIRSGMTGGTAVVENNIIYNSGAQKDEEWTKGNSKVTYSNNLYYNYKNLPSGDTAAITEDPKFVDPGKGPKEYTGKTPSSGGKIINDLSAFGGYKLKDDSPAINKGKIIDNNGGHDFFGNKILGVPDIGAYESSVASTKLNDNSIKSSVYIISEGSKTIYIPSLDNDKATVNEVLEGISVHETATKKIFNENSEVKEGNISEGMTLKVIAENNAENIYSIKIKNSYQWALDYTGAQGNVWFAQKKVSGVYSNLSTYDNTYPQWNGVNYAGIGVDLPNKTTVPTEATHGLLVDTMGTTREQGHAMTYRVPKSGTIVLSVKDNEPYLRQAGNSGGKVKLSFTHNGNEISSYELTESLTKINVEPMTIAVKKGDFIRVEALNVNNPTKPSIHITPSIEYKDIDEEKPTVPTEIKASNITETSAEISWKASSDNVKVTGYEVYNGENLLAKVNEETTVNISGLSQGTEYTLAIKAIDAAGNKSEAGTVTFKTKEEPKVEEPEVDKEAPTAPTEIKASNIKETSAEISWNASSDNVKVTGYEVYNGETLLAKVNDTTMVNISGLSQGTEYTLAIKAIDAAGNKSEAGIVTFKTKEEPKVEEPEVDKEPPTAPTEIKTSNITETSVDISWKASSDNVKVVAYEIYDGDKLLLTVNSKENATLIELKAGTEYTLIIKAVDAVGNKSEAGTVTFKTKEEPKVEEPEVDKEPPTSPTEIKTSNITETSVDISWKASSDNIQVVAYEIYDGDKLLLTVNNKENATLIGLKEGTEYTLIIKAVDAIGNKSEAGKVTFTTVKKTVDDDKEEPEKPTSPIVNPEEPKPPVKTDPIVPPVKEEEKEIKSDNNIDNNKSKGNVSPNTGDNYPIMLSSISIIVTLLGVVLLKKKNN